MVVDLGNPSRHRVPQRRAAGSARAHGGGLRIRVGLIHSPLRRRKPAARLDPGSVRPSLPPLLVLEFVPREDSMFQRLTRFRVDLSRKGTSSLRRNGSSARSSRSSVKLPSLRQRVPFSSTGKLPDDFRRHARDASRKARARRASRRVSPFFGRSRGAAQRSQSLFPPLGLGGYRVPRDRDRRPRDRHHGREPRRRPIANRQADPTRRARDRLRERNPRLRSSASPARAPPGFSRGDRVVHRRRGVHGRAPADSPRRARVPGVPHSLAADVRHAGRSLVEESLELPTGVPARDEARSRRGSADLRLHPG